MKQLSLLCAIGSFVTARATDLAQSTAPTMKAIVVHQNKAAPGFCNMKRAPPGTEGRRNPHSHHGRRS